MSARASASDASGVRPLRPVRDLGGIQVRDASGVSVGSIWGSLADARTGLIRYVDVALDDSSRHVLVPIGHARLRARDEDASAVAAEGIVTNVRTSDVADAHVLRLRAALVEELAAIPPYSPDAELDESYERAVVQAHGELFHGERYYAHPAFDHRGFYAGEHPLTREAGTSIGGGLVPLRTLRGYAVAAGEPDIRGWTMLGAENVRLGAISDLIIDVDAEQVRYVAVQRDSRRMLLPIGFLDIDTDRSRVHATGLAPDDLHLLPTWDGGPIERPQEEEVRHGIEEIFRGPRRYELPDFRPLNEDAVRTD